MIVASSSVSEDEKAMPKVSSAKEEGLMDGGFEGWMDGGFVGRWKQ